MKVRTGQTVIVVETCYFFLRFFFFLGTYHVDDRTDNLMNLPNLRSLGGHVSCSEGRKDGRGGLEDGGGIGEPGRSQRGADSPSRSKSSNPAKRWGRKVASAIERWRTISIDGERVVSVVVPLEHDRLVGGIGWK